MAERRHPFVTQPNRAFWRRAVDGVHPLEIDGWYRKKFSLAGRRLATGGSCFAQHIGREMRRRGGPVVDVEPPPGFLPPDLHLDYGYRIYSARYGNIYTSRQLLQLLQRAAGEIEPVDRAWARGDGFVDPFRPNIEPDAVGSVEEVEHLRSHHLARVAALFEQADAFVFTLGMTETWMSAADGAVFPAAPGTAGGVWDPSRYRLLTLRYDEVVADLEAVIARLRAINRDMHVLFTVSPVSMLATATADHVIVANSYSKSILRGAAGYLANKYPFVDYFPSYEIILAPPMRAMFCNADMRTVSAAGVRHVMGHFFAEHGSPARPAAPVPVRAARPAPGPRPGRVRVGRQAGADALPALATPGPDRVLCDEELAAVFGRA